MLYWNIDENSLRRGVGSTRYSAVAATHCIEAALESEVADCAASATLRSDDARSYNPMDIGVKRPSLVIAAFNIVSVVLSRVCFGPELGSVDAVQRGIGNSIVLTIYVARGGGFKVHKMHVHACGLSYEFVIRALRKCCPKKLSRADLISVIPPEADRKPL